MFSHQLKISSSVSFLGKLSTHQFRSVASLMCLSSKFTINKIIIISQSTSSFLHHQQPKSLCVVLVCGGARNGQGGHHPREVTVWWFGRRVFRGSSSRPCSYERETYESKEKEEPEEGWEANPHCTSGFSRHSFSMPQRMVCLPPNGCRLEE